MTDTYIDSKGKKKEAIFWAALILFSLKWHLLYCIVKQGVLHNH